MLRNFILLLGVIYLLIHSDLWAADKDEPWCGKPIVGYKLLEVDDLDDQFARQHYDSLGHDDPGKVTKDFNGDGLDDCAVLYVGEADDNYFVLLSIALNYDEWSVEEMFRLGHYKGLVFLSPVKAGTEVFTPQSFTDGHEYAKLLYTGIRVTYSEKAEFVYFWSEERQIMWAIQTVD